MDISRKLGIGIVEIIPTFVGAGAMWEIFGNWFSVIVWLIIMTVIIYKSIKGDLFDI